MKGWEGEPGRTRLANLHEMGDLHVRRPEGQEGREVDGEQAIEGGVGAAQPGRGRARVSTHTRAQRWISLEPRPSTQFFSQKKNCVEGLGTRLQRAITKEKILGDSDDLCTHLAAATPTSSPTTVSSCFSCRKS